MAVKDVYAGVDVGSSAIRVAVIDDSGQILHVETEKLDYHQSKVNPKFVTQSSTQIYQNYEKCMGRITRKLGSDTVVRSIGCAATCSMAVMKRSANGELVPYPVNYGFTDPDQNIVFWMDSRASKEAKDMNKLLEKKSVLDYYGGALIEEMAIPKAKYLIDNILDEDIDDIVFFDLHDFLTYTIAQNSPQIEHIVHASNKGNPVALDGELKGWSISFLKSIGLDQLAKDNFRSIGRLEKSNEVDFLPIPVAGSKLATTADGKVICQGVIDCYSSWIASCGKDFLNTLTMVAGTSTCFLLAHNVPTPVTGIWGPYYGIIDGYLVSEGGQSTTGKLIEHLFETHPAFKELESMGANVFQSLEKLIDEYEKDGGNIHFQSKEMFLYGDLSGNRTPYADGDMRGAFIGESTDTSIKDLVLRYVCILEFLALQTKQILQMLSSHHIKKIIISGSQAKNQRLVKLLALVTGLPVEVSNSNPEFAGAKGASYLGLSAYKDIPIAELIETLNQQGQVYDSKRDGNQKLVNLLEVKYKVMVDMAEKQREYRSWVSRALQ